MKISDALNKLSKSKRFLRRKAWPETVFITVCNNILAIHSHRNDPLGREYRPTLDDLTQNDWTVVETIH